MRRKFERKGKVSFEKGGIRFREEISFAEMETASVERRPRFDISFSSSNSPPHPFPLDNSPTNGRNFPRFAKLFSFAYSRGTLSAVQIESRNRGDRLLLTSLSRG